MAEQLGKSQWSALIVDDDPGVRQSLRLCLESEDARVLGVGSATAAIEALKHGWFDVVFFRVDRHGPAADPPVPGVGIGLYLCRQIGEAHGGSIHCESGPDGRGASLVVTLEREASPRILEVLTP